MFRRKRTHGDFQAEIEAHLANETEQLRRDGMNESDARNAARRAFGNATRAGERFYETGRSIWWDHLAADLRYAARALRRTPGLTLAVLATLALGIGANTAVFTVIDTVLLRPLPYPEAGRIVRISGPRGGSLSEPNYVYLAQHNPGLEDLSAYQASVRMNLNGGDRLELAEVIEASRNYFPLFGAHPLLGRAFTAAEDSPGGPRVLLVSYGLWQRRFGGDASILGRRVTLGGAARMKFDPVFQDLDFQYAWWYSLTR